MREYNDEILKRVQTAELSILKDFIQVCRENDISYFALAGTALGAVRHKGFIPWDDDIDVGLLRKDYEAVLDIFKREYRDKYTVVNGDSFSAYPLMTTRIMLNNTKFVEETLKHVRCPLGVFLDVYAYDNAPDEESVRRKQEKSAWLYSKLLILKHIPFPVLPFRGAKRAACHCVTAAVHIALNLFCVSGRYLYNKAKKYSCMYNNTETAYCGYFCDTNAYTATMKKTDIFPVQYLEFEDIRLACPAKTHEMLTDMFGDYMQLPPVKKRKNHYPYCLELNEKEAVSI